MNTLHQKFLRYLAVALLCCIALTGFATETPYNYFAKNQVSVGFYDKDFISFDISRPPSPLFWHTSNKADSGFYLMYRRLLYHSQKYFSIYFGTDYATWFSNNPNETLAAFSAFFELRWWIFRTRYFNPYLSYSIAGPTLISRTQFNIGNLGGHFLFQDFLGAGIQFGQYHLFNFALYLWHYSNGDLFTHNNGVDIPIVYEFSYSFS